MRSQSSSNIGDIRTLCFASGTIMLRTSSRAYATVFATDRDQEPQRALVGCACLFLVCVCVANAAAHLQPICSLFAAISSLRSRGMQILDFGVYRPSRTYMRCAIKVLLQFRQFLSRGLQIMEFWNFWTVQNV